MKKFYKYMLGKSKTVVSSWFDAEITRWTAVYGLIFSPLFLFTGVALENLHRLPTYAVALYAAAMLTAIPFIIEVSLTAKNND